MRKSALTDVDLILDRALEFGCDGRFGLLIDELHVLVLVISFQLLALFNIASLLGVAEIFGDGFLHQHSNIGGADGFADAVDGSDDIRARIFGTQMHDVERNVAEVEDGGDAGASGDRTAILVPFNSHGGVADWSQLGFEVGILAFFQVAQVLQWTDEVGLVGRGLLETLASLVLRVVLQVLDVLQARWVLGGLFDGGFLRDTQNGARFGDASCAGDAADVLAAVFDDDADQVQGDEAELERGVGTGACEMNEC